jgi:hypothetical protein
MDLPGTCDCSTKYSVNVDQGTINGFKSTIVSVKSQEKVRACKEYGFGPLLHA